MTTLSIGFAVFLGIFVAILLGQLAHGYLLLRRMRLGPGGSASVARVEVPADVRVILDEAAPTLAALGFEYLGSRRILPTLRNGQPDPSFADRYCHAATRSYAQVQPAELPEPGAATTVSFATHFADGAQLLTLNRREHLYLPLPPTYRVADGYLPDLTAQWELHRQRLATEQAGILPGEEELERREEGLRRQVFDFWLQRQVVTPAGEGLWRLTPRAAWGLLRRMMRGNRRLAKLPRRAVAAGDEALLAADLHAYRANEVALSQGVLQGKGKVLLFGLSAVAGILAFGLLLGWELVPVLVGVLLFHEFGHALAMRLTGYRNLQVLMIPFLGAVAVGRKDDAGHWTKLVVLLAGPLPGLLLAIGCAYALPDQGPASPLLVQVAVVALVLNLFNLLPFTPLDGGQIVETFLFARWPRLRFLFFLGSALALGALGLRMESQVLLALSLLLLVGVGGMRRRMQLVARVGQVTPEGAPGAIFAAIYRIPALAAATFPIRFRMARGALPLVVARPPRLWESLAGLAIYAAVIAVPLMALPDQVPGWQMLYSLLEPSASQAPAPRDWEAELAGASSPGQRWRVLSDAGAWLEDEEDEIGGAHRRYQQALEIAGGFPPGDLRLLDTRIALVRTGPSEAELPGYRELLPELRALAGIDRSRLADVLEAIHWVDQEGSTTERVARLREAIAVREALDDQETYSIVTDRREIAVLLHQGGDTFGAEAELRRNLEQVSTPDQVPPLAWLLIDTGRAHEASALIDAQPPWNSHRENTRLRETRAWAQYLQGDVEEGRRALSSLLAALPRNRGWERIFLLLDLIHMDEGTVRQGEWVEDARREIGQRARGVAGIGSYLRHQGELSPWERLRTQARQAALAGLGLPNGASCRTYEP